MVAIGVAAIEVVKGDFCFQLAKKLMHYLMLKLQKYWQIQYGISLAVEHNSHQLTCETDSTHYVVSKSGRSGSMFFVKLSSWSPFPDLFGLMVYNN